MGEAGMADSTNREAHVQPHEVVNGIVGQLDALTVPRYAGFATFARLPRAEDVDAYDIAVLGVPFDTGVSYRPGARFGPSHIRQSSRLLRPFNPDVDIEPFRSTQVVDAGDVPCTPFDILQAIEQIDEAATSLISGGQKLVSLGGDHTIALPLLRAMHRQHGPIALIHFDAHLDTWDTYFGAPYTHGTPFRRAWEEGLLRAGHCGHVGIRASLYSPQNLVDDAEMGFTIVRSSDFEEHSIASVAERLLARVGDAPVYLSVDIDVLDPAHAPGTGTPEGGGMTSRELLGILRAFAEANVVGADIVEVAPAYDHAEITGIAAANVAYEFVSVMAKAGR
jgi:agmatinase